MPPVHGSTWRSCRVEMDLTSDQAAGLLRITGAALRQIELNLKPASDRLIARAARLYRIPKEQLFKVLPAAEKTPAPKPKPEPKVEPVSPARRQQTEKRTAPKRVAGKKAVA